MKRLGKLSHNGTRLAYLQADPDPEREFVWHLYVTDPTEIPTVSEWGLIVMVLLGFVAAAIMFGRRRVALA